MLILICLKRRLPFLIFFLIAVFSNITCYYHWVLKLCFHRIFAFLLFIIDIEVYRFVNISSVCILKILNIIFFGNKFLVIVTILVISLIFRVYFLYFYFNLICISGIIGYLLESSLIWLRYILNCLHFALIVLSLFWRCNWNRCCFNVCLNLF